MCELFWKTGSLITAPQGSSCKRKRTGETGVLKTKHMITQVDDLVLGRILKECSREFPVPVRLVCRRWCELATSRNANMPQYRRLKLADGELFTTMNSSLLFGSFTVLEWLRLTYGNIPTIRYLYGSKFKFNYICNINLVNAVKGGHLRVLQWIQRFYPRHHLGWGLLTVAVQHDKTEILAWLLQANVKNKKYVDDHPFVHLEAIKYGRLDMLKILETGGKTRSGWQERIRYDRCGHLSDEGLFELMKWVSDNVRPWGETEITAAIEIKKPLTVKLLAEAGCQFSGEVMMSRALCANSTAVIDAVGDLMVRGVAKCDMPQACLCDRAFRSKYKTGVKWLHRKGIPIREMIELLDDKAVLYVKFWEWSCDVKMYMVTNVLEDKHLRMIADSPCVTIEKSDGNARSYRDDMENHLEFFDRFERFMRKKNGRDEPVFNVNSTVSQVLRCGIEGFTSRMDAFFQWIMEMGYLTKDFVPTAEHYCDAARWCRVSTLRLMDGYSDRNAEWSKIVDETLTQKNDFDIHEKGFTRFLDYLLETKRLTVSKKTFIDSMENPCDDVFIWLVSSFPLVVKRLDCATVSEIINRATFLTNVGYLSSKVLGSITTKP